MPEIEIEKLIDQELIARADAKMTAAVKHLQTCEADLETKQSALATARRIAADLPSLEAEAALEQATREASVAEKTHRITLNFFHQMGEWLPLARGAAHRRLYMAGIRARIEAARKADQARKLLAEAIEEFKEARWLCERASEHQHLGNVHNDRIWLVAQETKWPISEAEELSAWRSRNIDPFSNTNDWAEHVLKQEPK